MTDSCCIYHISYPTTQKKNTHNGFGVSNYYKKVKIESNVNLGKILKKYLYKNKYLSFRKVVVLEPAIILKMIFNSGNFSHLYKTLQNIFLALYTYIKK